MLRCQISRESLYKEINDNITKRRLLRLDETRMAKSLKSEFKMKSFDFTFAL